MILIAEKVFPATKETLSNMIEFIEASFANQLEKPKLLKLLLIAEEALTNTIFYGYQNDNADKCVTIHCSYNDNEAITKITDNGIPYNPLEGECKYVATDLSHATPGGLGKTFIKKFADQVYYNRDNQKNNLIIIMYKDKK